MCGIVGVASSYPQGDRDWLTVGMDQLIHRGPDDGGTWWSDDFRVGLAHRRLSILDLSPSGHQPMSSPNLEILIVFNGEIYNFHYLKKKLIDLGYHFRSQSDTEVIIASYQEWGQDCLQQLNGMFAFAIYDLRNKKVFMARDRAGEKPLFYRMEDKTIFFASELKALLANKNAPRKINPASMDCYLHMGYIPGSLCIFQGYAKLPAAHALEFDLESGTSRCWKYWNIPDFQESLIPGSDEEILEEFESLLDQSVKRQLVADVPVGILLSGGVDSSLITAMAKRNADQVKTFTVSFPGQGNLDESVFARKISDYFGTEHHELKVDSISPDLIPKLARQFDEPMVDSSMIPTYIVTKMVSEHCKVVLGGDGGDELFGGYAHYSRLISFRKKYGILPKPARELIAFLAEKYLEPGMKNRNLLIGLGADLKKYLPLTLTYNFDATTRRKLMQDQQDWGIVSGDLYRKLIPTQSNLMDRAMRMDFISYLAEDILVKVDRTSMLNSLEVRAPFLDLELIEFAFSKVPDRLKVTKQEKKILPKKLTEKVLPTDFDRKRKQGFSIPIAKWLEKGPLRELAYDQLLSQDCIFHRPTVQKLLEGQDKGRATGEKIYSLILFELWRKEYLAQF